MFDEPGLFDNNEEENRNHEPLASRMRPETFEDLAGQKHLTKKDGILLNSIEKDTFRAMIFFGPPGIGKTTIARIISNLSNNRFKPVNAVLSNIAELRQIFNEAKSLKKIENISTIIFIDEIHRFNKAQQDALLPYLEDGSIRFIGATTYNPSFYITPALRSRCLILELFPLEISDIKENLERVLKNPEGFNNKFTADEELLTTIAKIAQGDMRRSLNILEIVVQTGKSRNLTIKDLPESLGSQPKRHDRNGEDHYNVVSAFIKSMRGSDIDATTYWLARMIDSGEDPRFIARRIIICAAEDVGLADPRALTIALNAFQSVEVIGMPEGRIVLSMAALYVATAPKSNSAYLAIKNAQKILEENEFQEVPHTLCNNKKDEYLYPHDYKNGYVNQKYLKRALKLVKLKPIGYERKLLEYLERLINENGRAPR